MRTIHAIAGWLVCLSAGLLLHLSGILAPLDRAWLDWEFSVMREHFLQPAHNDVVIVGIDEAFLRDAPEPLALLHRHLGTLFAAIAAGKPRATALDIVFPEKSFSFLVPKDDPGFDFDRELARGLLLLGNAAPLIIGETWDNAHSRFRDILPAFVAAAGQWALARGGAGFDHRGSALVCPDPDGVVREFPGAHCQPGGMQRTLAGQVARLQERDSEVEGYINYMTGGEFSYLPGKDVVAWHRAGDSERLKALADRTVLVGVVLDNEDRLKSPVPLAAWEPGNQLVPGVTIQAQMMRSLLNQGLIRPLPSTVMLLLIALAAGFWLGRSLWLRLALLLPFAGVLAAASLLGLRDSLFLPPTAIMATALLALGAAAAVAGRRHWLERQFLTRTFSGYVSPQVLKGILSGRLAAGQQGERQQVCVLFSDIRDFTTISEHLAADRVVELLNAYFDRMARIVHHHGGLVDKFIGDGMMALFGTPQRLPCPEKNAMEAAREMLLAVEELNVVFRQRNLPEIRIGIGVHSGEAVIGHLGSSERHEYTAIGDAVNVAARVCDLPKSTGFPIICTAPVAAALAFPDFLADVGIRAVKGHSDLQVFGWNPDAASQGGRT